MTDGADGGGFAAGWAADQDLLGLELGAAGRASFVLTRPLARFDGRLFGGTALAVAIALAADMVPMGVLHALGHMGGGTSLDNTIRLAAPADSEWILLQLDPQAARGGFGHGTAHVWSPDGALLATASQTAALLVLD